VTPDLRDQIRAGNREAFAALFDRYARAVYNHAFHLTADWSLAEDVLSTTFLQAWRLRDRVDPDGGSLRPWLLGIATNTARNARRGNRRYRTAVAALGTEEPTTPDHADTVAGQVDDTRQLAAVMAALGALRRTEREVLTLCLWEGLDYAAAAAALGIPVGTVRSRLSRARAKLRTIAGPDREPGSRRGQVRGDRTIAARTAQEGQR
jgi:RNA polymerase sigma-70 factor (ECF subfamily)